MIQNPPPRERFQRMKCNQHYSKTPNTGENFISYTYISLFTLLSTEYIFFKVDEPTKKWMAVQPDLK